MPRYLVTTYDGITVSDPGGIELPDLDALAIVLRQTLSAIMHDEGGRPGRNEFWADVSNGIGMGPRIGVQSGPHRERGVTPLVSPAERVGVAQPG